MYILREEISGSIQRSTLFQCSYAQRDADVVENQLASYEFCVANVVSSHKEDVSIHAECEGTFQHPNHGKHAHGSQKWREMSDEGERRNRPQSHNTQETRGEDYGILQI